MNAAGTDFELDIKYEMIKPIGHGAYGVVISAQDHESNSKVCVGAMLYQIEFTLRAMRYALCDIMQSLISIAGSICWSEACRIYSCGNDMRYAVPGK